MAGWCIGAAVYKPRAKVPRSGGGCELEQDHKRWSDRRELIVNQLEQLQPDVMALNEVCIPLQTGRFLQQALGVDYNLIQQSKVNGLSQVDGEGLLTKFLVKETANFDYRARDSVAQVARLEIDGYLVDVYVTHLYQSRGEDSLRLYQVQQLLDWIIGGMTWRPV